MFRSRLPRIPSLPTRRRFSSTVPFCVLALVLVLGTPALAQDWQARFHGQWISSSAETVNSAGLGDGVGAYFGVERRLNDRWGIEVGIARGELDSKETVSLGFFGLTIDTEIRSQQEWMPLTLAANYHLPTRGDFDLYLAPRIGWVFFDDLEIATRVDGNGTIFLPGFPVSLEVPDLGEPGDQRLSIGIDDAFLYGLRLGFERPFGSGGWSLSGAVSLDVIELESDQGAVGDLDPLTVGIGFARRF